MSWMQSQISPSHTIYIPNNSTKFIGTYVVCRSSWEKRFAQWCDNNPNIVLWSSESLAIQYTDPVQKNKTRRYYPDFVIKTKTGETFVVEIKPSKETKPPRNSKRRNPVTYLKEQKTYLTNMAKWKAAQCYCEKNGFQFKLVTEKALNL